MGSTADPQLQWIEDLYQLSEQAWIDHRFVQANELSRQAEMHELEYRTSQRRAA
ncbi:MAG: hypothetical protein ACREN8_13215 [Candidatus Dormibacteraceae bacterium]